MGQETSEEHIDRAARAFEAALHRGLEAEAAILRAGTAIREQSKVEYGTALLDARLTLTAVVADSMGLHAGEPAATDADRSAALALVASFVQGISVVEVLISEGQYIKAAAVLKQDLEILARLGEHREGVARPGQTPKVKYAPTGAGRWYGELNKVAHPSNPELINELLQRRPVGEQAGVSFVPAFNAEVAVGLYEVHVWTMLMLARDSLRLIEEMYGRSPESTELIRRWLAAAEMLRGGGHVSEVVAT